MIPNTAPDLFIPMHRRSSAARLYAVFAIAVVFFAFVQAMHAAPPKRRLVTINTAAGKIIVAPEIADRMRGFVADVVARGFHGPVHCYSWARSHVRHSLHHSGNACDFAQHWARHGRHIQTHPVMRHVSDLAAKWGFRDGCSFNDCGHIDAGDLRSRAVALY